MSYPEYSDPYSSYDRTPEEFWRYEPPRPTERLRHVIFLDGRLVDSWTCPVEGTDYAELARALERQRLALPEPTPDPPPWERVLTWLDDLVGGRRALLGLTSTPLSAPLVPVSATEDYHEVAAVLETIAARLFDAETGAAFQIALAALWETGRQQLLGAKSPAHAAAAIVWMVGRANGIVGSGTAVTQRDLNRVVGVSTSPTTLSTRLRAELRGLARDQRRLAPAICPDLLGLARADLLLSSTRRVLLALRDRAFAAAAANAQDEQARGSVLPLEVES